MHKLIVVAALAAASPAWADAPKYTRKTAPPPVAQPSARVKPHATEASTPRAPTVTGDEVLAGMKAAGPLREEQAALLVQLIRDTPDNDPDKPDYMFRLAEHYAAQLRMWRLEAISVDLEIHKRTRH